jgi:hypothetical protein
MIHEKSLCWMICLYDEMRNKGILLTLRALGVVLLLQYHDDTRGVVL